MQPSLLGLASRYCQGTCRKEELKVKLFNFHQRLCQNIFICVIKKFSLEVLFLTNAWVKSRQMAKAFCRSSALCMG